MELHKALKEIIANKGVDIMNNVQIINYLLDYQAFKEKPAIKLILRDIINSGYVEDIMNLNPSTPGWQVKFKQYAHDFVDSCGYKEELAIYVFESIAYGLGLQLGAEEPCIEECVNVDSFFEIPETESQQAQPSIVQPSNTVAPQPTDLYSIALTFYHEGKYQQAKSFVEKSISMTPSNAVSSDVLRLLGDIYRITDCYRDAIKAYNECFAQKSKESRMSIDALRDALKQHKVKGYENIMFCYYYCLHYANQITDAQWMHTVKSEARAGIDDAIMFCADNGINPIDSHYDIFFVDISKVSSNDWLYEDGSFSHEESSVKKAIANIALVQTSDYEKKQGWTHGYIIPLENAQWKAGAKGLGLFGFIYKSQYEQCLAWSTQKDDLPFPHSHYTEDDLNHWYYANKVESEYLIKFNKQIESFPAFMAVENFHVNLPLSNVSPWFLPSIHTIKRLESYRRLFTYGCHFWTSSQANASCAIGFQQGTGINIKYEMFEKSERLFVKPIAAF